MQNGASDGSTPHRAMLTVGATRFERPPDKPVPQTPQAR
jgi:hypothetical protein